MHMVSSAGVIDIGDSNRDQASLYILFYGKSILDLDDICFDIVFNITDVLLDTKAIAVNFWPVSLLADLTH